MALWQKILLGIFYFINTLPFILFVAYIIASTIQARAIRRRMEVENARLNLELLDPIDDADQFKSANQNGLVPKEALLSELWSLGTAEQGECAICLEPLINERVIKTICNHTFDLLCLDTWLTQHQTCPICRC